MSLSCPVSLPWSDTLTGSTVVLDHFCTESPGTGSDSIVASAPGYPSNALKLNGVNSWAGIDAPSASSTWQVRGRWMVTSVENQTIIQHHGGADWDPVWSITSGGEISFGGFSTVATSSGAGIVANTWYSFDFRYETVSTTITYTAKINGVTVLTGTTSTGVMAGISRSGVRFWSSAGGAGDTYFYGLYLDQAITEPPPDEITGTIDVTSSAPSFAAAGTVTVFGTIAVSSAPTFAASGTYTVTGTIGVTAPSPSFSAESGLALSCNNPPGGEVGTAYSHFPYYSGGTAPYWFEIASGSLPPGLTLDASTGVISGTPTTAGTYAFRLRLRSS